MLFRCLLIFFKIKLGSVTQFNQAQHFVTPDLGTNCLQRLSADDTSRQRVKNKCGSHIS